MMSSDPTTHITHLGIDASALISAGWPKPSVDLENVVIGCRSLDIPVLVPELVLWEAEHVWLRRSMDLVNSARDAVRRVRRADQLSPPSVDWPTEENYQKSYLGD